MTTCTHERWEQIAAADGGDPGGCPICMSAEIDRLREEIKCAHLFLDGGYGDNSNATKHNRTATLTERISQALQESAGQVVVNVLNSTLDLSRWPTKGAVTLSEANWKQIRDALTAAGGK